MKTKILIPLLTLTCLLTMPAMAQVNYAIPAALHMLQPAPNASGNIVSPP